MRVRVAFAAARRRSDRLALWDRAVAGQKDALAVVAAWIVEGGIDLSLLLESVSDGIPLIPWRRGGAAAGASCRTSRRDFCIALARLMSTPSTLWPVQPAQIALARYGDFVRDDGAVGAMDRDGTPGPVVVWQVRDCRGFSGDRAVLRGWALDAWKVTVRYRRTAAPAVADPLIAPRRNGTHWDARAVRYAAEIGRRAAGIPEGIDASCGGGHLRRWGDGSDSRSVPEAFFAQLASAMGEVRIAAALAARRSRPASLPPTAVRALAAPVECQTPVIRALDEFGLCPINRR